MVHQYHHLSQCQLLRRDPTTFAKEFSVLWNGKGTPKDTTVKIVDHGEDPGHQTIASHFGMGVVTIQNRFTLRTGQRQLEIPLSDN
jgi:hypothetical protein